MSSFLKKGNRSNKIRLYREAQEDLKNINVIQEQMKELSEAVIALITLRKDVNYIPDKKELLDIISIVSDSLEMNLKLKYQKLCVTGIIDYLKALGLKENEDKENNIE